MQLHEALELVNKAIHAAPACAKYRHSKGLILEKADQLEEAADSLERACEKDPSSAKVGSKPVISSAAAFGCDCSSTENSDVEEQCSYGIRVACVLGNIGQLQQVWPAKEQ